MSNRTLTDLVKFRGQNSIGRRQIVGGLLTAPVVVSASNLAGCKPESKSSSFQSYDLTDPEDNVELYVKVVGDLKGGRTYLQYETDVTLIKSHSTPQVLYKIKGIARIDWTKVGPFHYKQRNFDHGLICDAKTGRVIDEYKNPISGEINHPIHYRSGPFNTDVSPNVKNGEWFAKPWQSSGGALWFTESSSGARKNWLSPEEWPMASTGDDVHFWVSSTYLSELEYVSDRSRTSAPMTHLWSFSTPFPPWMLLGDEPGTLIWNWVARKIHKKEDLDPYIVSEIEKRHPHYFNEADPWRDKVNGWTQYKSERQAKTPRGVLND
ncbi:MAG: DUF1838 family protein [Alphaproteobacteria bacterium]